MTVRSRTSLGAPIWAELSTSDLHRAEDFYGAAFGWTFESPGPEYGGYVNAAADGHLVAGLMPVDPQWQRADGWSTYLHTDDVDATIAKAVELFRRAWEVAAATRPARRSACGSRPAIRVSERSGSPGRRSGTS